MPTFPYFCAALALLPVGCAEPQAVPVAASRNYPRVTPQASTTPRPKPTPEPKGTATGRVVGTDGKPLAGVSVWVIASYAGIRQYNETFTMITGADGLYRVAGLPSVQNHSEQGRMQSEPGDIGIAVYVVSPGRPFGNQQSQATTDTSVLPDIVLPATGSTLAVRVVNEQGQPVVGVTVEASATSGGSSPVRFWAYEMNKDQA